jgi:hypothetical protein
MIPRSERYEACYITMALNCTPLTLPETNFYVWQQWKSNKQRSVSTLTQIKDDLSQVVITRTYEAKSLAYFAVV